MVNNLYVFVQSIIIISIISDSVQNLKGVWVHNTNTKVQGARGAKLQRVVQNYNVWCVKLHKVGSAMWKIDIRQSTI